jgi:hypothetical protein
MAMATKSRLPLWRVTARHPKLAGLVQVLVGAATRELAIEIVSGGATVTRCVREVRS